MIISFILAAFSQTMPGPLDAFRANYASVKVEVDFIYKSSNPDKSQVAGGRLWDGRVEITTEAARTIFEGRWDCDGTVERSILTHLKGVGQLVDSAPGVGRKGLEKRDAPRTSPRLVYEVMFDGQTVAYRNLDMTPETLTVAMTDNPPMSRPGPFSWGGPAGFPLALREDYPNASVRRGTAMRGGHPTEVEIYTQAHGGDAAGGWSRFEVSYDPALGYLPRFTRGLSFNPTTKTASVNEFYLMDARPCKAGGFVPTEWFETRFNVEDFAVRHPNYDDNTALTHSGSRRVVLNHFKATAIRDRSAPVRFDQLDGVRTISAPGGIVPVRNPSGLLTLKGLRSNLGKKLEPSHTVLPHLDEAELREYAQPPRRPWAPYVLGGLFVAIPVGVFVGYRRWRSPLVLIGLLAISGCGGAADPRPHLVAAFTRTRLISDPNMSWMPMTLVVKNDGARPIRLRNVDGGCACRRVDQSHFPVLLKPNASLRLPVQIEDRRDYEPQSFTFTFESDHGSLVVPVALFALPRHHLSPETPAHTAMNEDDDWTFELVHREVYEQEAARPATKLDVPPEFAATEVGTHKGRVGGAPEFAFEDTTYRVTLKDRGLGLHKAAIRLLEPSPDPKGGSHRALVEAPVVWQRVPFLSSTPARVTLATRPVRVFLRCPDEDVELTRVLSAPSGIQAAVSSTRELTVRIAKDAPGVIDGVVEVGTTAADRPPLRIPVVRYAPLARR